jgi:hypothetical protein
VRAQQAAILDTLQHLVDQVGWLGEESVQLRSDVASLRTELSHVHGDLSPRYGEAIDAVRSLEPPDRASPPAAAPPPERPDPAEHDQLLAAIFGKPKRTAAPSKPAGAKAAPAKARANARRGKGRASPSLSPERGCSGTSRAGPWLTA